MVALLAVLCSVTLLLFHGCFEMVKGNDFHLNIQVLTLYIYRSTATVQNPWTFFNNNASVSCFPVFFPKPPSESYNYLVNNLFLQYQSTVLKPWKILIAPITKEIELNKKILCVSIFLKTSKRTQTKKTSLGVFDD